MSTGNELLREERTAEEKELLEKVTDGLGMSILRFQQRLRDPQRTMDDVRN
jgi:hypothetical protein